MTTPPCTALVKTKGGKPAPPGTLCSKDTATVSTPDGPRCFTHLKREKRLQDPGSRIPVRNPKSPSDIERNVIWAMNRAAENKLSAPQSNAVSNLARVWLKLHADRYEKILGAMQDIQEANLEMLKASKVVDHPRYNRANVLIRDAFDRLSGLSSSPPKETDADVEDRLKREHDRIVSALDPDDAPLDHEEEPFYP